jgi:alkylation response protein AidB-like acyl-CoA dehydrogenase
LDFNLTEDQARLQESIRRFAEKEVAPIAERLDAEAVFPTDLYHKVAEMGITSIPFPAEHGGMGFDTLEMVIALEQLARADQSLAATTMVSVACGLIMMRYGTKEQVARYLPDIVSGKAIGAIAGTEPQAGSWTAGITTRARKVDGGWMLNGEKAYITNAGTPLTSYVLVMAVSSEPDAERKQYTLFIVPAGTKGFTPGEPYKKLGWRSSDTRPLYFDDCFIADDSILGDVHGGRILLHRGYQQARVFLSACSVGLAQACIDHSIEFANNRKAFKGTIGSLQMVQDMIAEMAVCTEASRLLTYRAAKLSDEGTASLRDLAYAKYFATENGTKCADLAIQVHGGWGFMDDCAVSRYYRDNRVCTIGDGASQIQKLIMARDLGLDVQF